MISGTRNFHCRFRFRSDVLSEILQMVHHFCIFLSSSQLVHQLGRRKPPYETILINKTSKKIKGREICPLNCHFPTNIILSLCQKLISYSSSTLSASSGTSKYTDPSDSLPADNFPFCRPCSVRPILFAQFSPQRQAGRS